jgi:sugar/nucleoside kinase (ribokinase family)
MGTDQGSILVVGNVTLDIICKTVDEVPRFDSIAFQDAAVTPGGCASNVAIGLAQLGENPFLVACLGDDQAAEFLMDSWKEQGVDTRYINRIPGKGTGVSVGLVDSDFQPRFIHTSGANAEMKALTLNREIFQEQRIAFMHIAGYFVLPGFLEPGFAEKLAMIQKSGVFITLDVVRSPAMKSPEFLKSVLPHLNVFMCNHQEAEIISGIADPTRAARTFQEWGASAVIIKLGAAGCFLAAPDKEIQIPGIQVESVVDTTGAGDAFAAGLLSGLKKGLGLAEACQVGVQQGAKTTGYLGAVQLD